jgi:uncharacterized membrane protein YphA (DoxX/SURF4 family)
MAETAIVASRRVSPASAITWIFRFLLAAYFVNVGARKLGGATMWVNIFEQIGAGQWFRYFTGWLQVVGAILLLIPRAFVAGIGVLVCTMVGAMLGWVFVLNDPRAATLPAVVLAILVAIATAVRRSNRSSGAALYPTRVDP